ncbi:MAG TPA: phosphatidylglycerophosphatase A [Pelomicrobium sp.]|nr:phosphatidylglycerophosphatase A [Pelomicrobium sp.]
MTISADAGRRPGWRFVFGAPAPLVAFGFGLGLSPVAPGTVATLATLPLFHFLAPRLGDAALIALAAAMFALGVWACQRTGRLLGAHDHGGMVWDEITAFLLVLTITPRDPVWQAFAFLLFRGFDIAKPPPIRRFERRFRNGFGVMADDLIAAFYALLCLALWRYVFG